MRPEDKIRKFEQLMLVEASKIKIFNELQEDIDKFLNVLDKKIDRSKKEIKDLMIVIKELKT